MKPLPASQGLQFVDLTEFCARIPETAASPENISKKLASIAGASPSPPHIAGVVFTADSFQSHPHAASAAAAAKRVRSPRSAAMANAAAQSAASASAAAGAGAMESSGGNPMPPALTLANMMGSAAMQTPLSAFPPPPPAEGGSGIGRTLSFSTKSSYKINVSNISTTIAEAVGAASMVTATVLREDTAPTAAGAASVEPSKAPTPTSKRFGRSQSEKLAGSPRAAPAVAALKDMGLSTVAPSIASPAPAPPAPLTVTSTPAPDTAGKSDASTAATYTNASSAFDSDDFYSVQRSPAPTPSENLHSKYGK